MTSRSRFEHGDKADIIKHREHKDSCSGPIPARTI